VGHVEFWGLAMLTSPGVSAFEVSATRSVPFGAALLVYSQWVLAALDSRASCYARGSNGAYVTSDRRAKYVRQEIADATMDMPGSGGSDQYLRRMQDHLDCFRKKNNPEWHVSH